jgi:hypothetical protein
VASIALFSIVVGKILKIPGNALVIGVEANGYTRSIGIGATM